MFLRNCSVTCVHSETEKKTDRECWTRFVSLFFLFFILRLFVIILILLIVLDGVTLFFLFLSL